MLTRDEKLKIARQGATDGIVLLKNEGNVLPILSGEVSLFGIASYRCFKMGWGSGDMICQKPVQIVTGLQNNQMRLNQDVLDFYQKSIAEHHELYERTNRNWDEWTYRYEELEIDENLIKNASKTSKIALVTIGRCSGETGDLKDEEGYLKLSKSEENLLKQVSKSFEKVVLLLNTCGFMDLENIESLNVQSILYVSLGGEQIGNAVADIVCGKATPSGKLAFSWAYHVSDYPTNEGTETKEVPYTEGIYVGYRYFDTFGRKVKYPFGYGLSYSDFTIETVDFSIYDTIIDTVVKVKNVGKTFGKEVVQLYLSAPSKNLEKPYQELCAYAKTNVLYPNDEQELVLSFDITDFASFDEKTASYILEEGTYFVRVGNQSRNTHIIGKIIVENDTVCYQTVNRMNAPKDLKTISAKGCTPYSYPNEQEEKDSCIRAVTLDKNAVETLVLDRYEDRKIQKFEDKGLFTLQDVQDGKATLKDVVSHFSFEDIGNLTNGAIHENSDKNNTVGGQSTKIRGAAGEMWAPETYKIPVNACADGPSGVRLTIFGSKEEEDGDICKAMVSYPSGTCLANTWDLEIARKFGECVCADLTLSDIEGWLAPGLNIQRTPLNGRNFEYFSEDPLIAGKTTANIVIGVQYDENAEPTGRYATIKHFACNDIEYERGLSDSIVSERALREIYLKGFKIAVEEGNPYAVMTAYNKINGEFCSTNFDLLNGLLRGEWGFDGMVMTDWWTAANPKRHLHAGNDLIMPGYHNKDIKEGLENGEIDETEARECCVRLLQLIMKTNFQIKK